MVKKNISSINIMPMGKIYNATLKNVPAKVSIKNTGKTSKQKRGRKKRKKAVTGLISLQQTDRVSGKLKWEATFQLSNTAGNAALKLFRGNSPRDPEHAVAVSNSAQLFDKYAALYTRYRTFGSTIKLTIIPYADSIGATTIEACILPATIVGPFSSYEFMAAQKNARTHAMNLYDRSTYKPIKYYMPTAKMFGLSKSAIRNDIYWSDLVTNDPLDQESAWYWHVALKPMKDIVATNFMMKVTMYFNVEFFNLKYNLPPALVDMSGQTGPTGTYQISADIYGRVPDDGMTGGAL